MLPAIENMQQVARRSCSANNLKGMSLSVANISGNFSGKVPAGFGPFPNSTDPARGFFFHILPFIEHDNVYKAQAFNTPIKTYHNPNDPSCPSDSHGPTSPSCSYGVNGRAFGGFCPNGPVAFYPRTFQPKGTSYTVMVFERYASLNGKWAGAPADNADGSCILYGPHTDLCGAVKDPSFNLPVRDPNCTLTANGYAGPGLQVALTDGSVRTVLPSVTAWPSPSVGTSIWGWAISPTGPAEGQFGKAPPPAEW
jgi:hypothetical protein